MFDLPKLVDDSIANFFANFIDQMIKIFSQTLANVMSTSISVLEMPLVQNGMKYSQLLAITLLVAKAICEALNTYILYTDGDPDADPGGFVIRVGQATATVMSLPWIVEQVFVFGTKLTNDVAALSVGQAGVKDWTFLLSLILSTGGAVIALTSIAIVILLLIVAIQSGIRGGELALMSVTGSIMALNLTSNNRSIWSAWFKQLIIICCGQALQIFMIKGSLSIVSLASSVSGNTLITLIGWLWVTIKTPKFIQQIAYSTGFTGAVGGTVKQAGSMAIMRRVMRAA